MAKGSGPIDVVGQLRKRSASAARKYSNWVNKQPGAVEEARKLARTASSIPNKKARERFIRRERQLFDRKWIDKFSKRGG